MTSDGFKDTNPPSNLVEVSEMDVYRAAQHLALWAQAYGWNVTIERAPAQPLSIGNHYPLVKVWKRK